MVYPKGSKTEQPIVDAATKEIKDVLGGRLGATLVESSDPLWQRDPDVEQMKVDYRVALARLVPVFMPDLLFRLRRDGTPLFKEFAEAITPTEFLPGKVFGSGTMSPIDYCVALAEGRIAPPVNLDLGTIQQQELSNTFRFHISQYLSRRAEDWKAKGFTESLADWAALNARSKFWGDDQRAAFKNWEEVTDPRNPLNGRQGVNERIMLRELLRRADMMVILENKLDALVRLHTPWPPGLIGHAYQYDIASNLRPESLSGPNAGLTEVLIPAGYVTTAYDPVYKLTPDGKKYVSQASDKPTKLAEPGLPFSLVFRCEPGKEDIVLRIASAYEAASKRRIPPPAFGRWSGVIPAEGGEPRSSIPMSRPGVRRFAAGCGRSLIPPRHLLHQRVGIRRCRIAGPHHVLIGPHQDHARLVGLAAAAPGVLHRLQRHAERCRRPLDRCDACFVRAECQQREVRSQFVERAAAG